MNKQRSAPRNALVETTFIGDFDPSAGPAAARAETAEYLAQMAAELITLASTARLSRLCILLDFVRREAEAESGSAGIPA